MHLADGVALLRHAEWADALVWKEVLRAGREDGELREKLHHLHQVQWVYLQLWRRKPYSPRALEELESLVAIRDWAREYYSQLPPLLETLSEADLTGELSIPWADRLVERFGRALPATVGESLLQVSLHSSYHRGQVNRRLRELGGEPPLTDYIAWVWTDRPSADWGDGSGGG